MERYIIKQFKEYYAICKQISIHYLNAVSK